MGFRIGMKISEIFALRPVNDGPCFNGRRLDRQAGGVVDAEGAFQALRPQSIRVLALLVDRAGEVVTKDEIFAAVWSEAAVTDDSLTQCIGDIRRALGDIDRRILETVPRRGFCLRADQATPRQGLSMVTLAGCFGFACLVLAVLLWPDRDREDRFPTVSIEAEPEVRVLAAEVGAALDRFGTVRRLSQGGRFVLTLTELSDARLSAEVIDSTTSTVVLARTVAAREAPELSGARLAVLVASPWAGAVAETMIETALEKPLEALTGYECYLHAFRQDGEAMLRRAHTCLDAMIAADPSNARAHALLGAVYTTEYWYGAGLEGPARENRHLRDPLAVRALATVEAAEAAGLPEEAEFHLSTAISYYANCKLDHMAAALNRAMALNPNDPWILGKAGNFLAYSGTWEIGVQLAKKAIELAEEDGERWWWWAIGKDHWRRGQDAAALDAFMRGYMEGDWHTQLHLAYTLPGLGRLADAQRETERLREVYPGFTREDARESHYRWCFEPNFIARMDGALVQAGLVDGPAEMIAPADVALGVQ